MLRGPNFAGNAELCNAVGPDCKVIASGGITTADDIRRLRALGKPNLIGAIVGKALYEGLTTMGELLAVARAGAGTNNINVARATDKGICIFNTPGANANAVVDLIFPMIGVWRRNISITSRKGSLRIR